MATKEDGYLLFLPSLELGGAERQALNFASYLRKKKVNCVITSLATKGRLLDLCKEEGIKYEPLIKNNSLYRIIRKTVKPVFLILLKYILHREYWNGPFISILLAFYLYRNHYKALIAYCATCNTIAGLTKFLYKGKTRIIWYQRDAGIYNCPDFLQRLAVRKVNCILANSISGQKFIQKTYNLYASIIYNGVKLSPQVGSDEEWRKKLSIDENTLVASMIANLSNAKDHATLIRAWSIVCSQITDKKVLLLLAGRFDDQYEYLKNMVSDSGLVETVIFLGQVNDITGLLHVSTISVFSAKSEGSPNGIIEACLSGLAVAGTNLPEIREVLNESNYEYLSTKEDSATLAKNIIRLLLNDDIRVVLGKRNKEKAEALFQPEKNFRMLEDITCYRQVRTS